MREGWRELALGDIASIERGKFSPRPRNDPKYYGGSIPFIQTGDVSRASNYIRGYSQTLNESGLAVSKLFPSGTIMMGIAANVGDVGILTFDSACPDSVVGITPNQDIEWAWLFQVLKTMKPTFEALSTQNAQKNLNLEKLKPVRILVPPIEEQKKIAEILRAWDQAIEKVERQESLFELQKHGLMKKLLVDDIKNRKTNAEWVTFTLKEVAEIVTGNTPPTNKPEYYGGEYLFVSPADISDSVYLQKSAKSLSEAGLKKTRVVPKDAVLFTCIGIIGKLCISPSILATNQQINAVIPDSKKVDIIFLYYTLSQSAKLIKLMASTNVIPIINKSTFGETTINLPDLKEQNRISNILYRHDLAIENLKKKKKLLQSQKRGLMQLLLDDA